ncbi:oxidoreductase [Rathayibacter caricis DSM 15933]|jgi:short-subunit dehydrogenase involved in D-alanine esterification of teichoic acids|uniref:Oxidoreductase n=1 Tax=Rathayibacter caricis DSM 15933 TaxID=1328867 RepID=A0A2T4UQB1_9MICO|nr:SDR family NAD(P)-dependent oxidoreductase [Rathayibacter caricis]MCJ1697369.1 SDR family NAD(P)-dependent oxidoreductase [Rathayibacter caricis]PTL71718.1 oxidoreductase [Rathayibacter caricis DSM 15933]
MNLTGNTILITGGTSGIGLGLALRLHESGNTVIVAGRRTALLDAITAEHPGIHGIELDVSDTDSLARAKASIEADHPELNVLINNAGIMRQESVLDPADVRVAEDHIAVNLLGTIRATYAFLPTLLGKEGAAVLNVTSALAFVPFPTTPTYSATKAALHSFTDALRVQLAESGVQVVEIVPPGVQTDLFGPNEHALPLDDFLTELLGLLEADPSASELVVQNARPLRDAVADGTYSAVLASLSGA